MNTSVTHTRPSRWTTPTAMDVNAGFRRLARCGGDASSASMAWSTEPAYATFSPSVCQPAGTPSASVECDRRPSSAMWFDHATALAYAPSFHARGATTFAVRSSLTDPNAVASSGLHAPATTTMAS